MSSEENKLNIQNITQELHELNLLLSLEDTQLITVLDQLPTSETNYKTLQLKINP